MQEEKLYPIGMRQLALALELLLPLMVLLPMLAEIQRLQHDDLHYGLDINKVWWKS